MTAPVGGRPTADTLPGQALVNRLVRGMLRTPLVCRLLGRRLLTVYVVGRRSGRHYPVPVAFCHHQGRLLVATQFRWIRNLRSGEQVPVRLMGRRRMADTEVLTEETEVVELLAFMARDNHGFARFNNIGIDKEGEPRREDLERAWRGGARVAALSPH